MISIRRQLPVYSPVSAKAAFLASAQLLHLGEDPRPALAALLAKEYNATHVVLTGSGTQALTLAIQEAQRRVDPKAPVALPAFSCFDVASAAIGADVSVSLYDLDPDTLGPDLESLERVLRAGAGVVVAAPLYGMPIDWPPLAALAKRYGAVLIEDAAQGHGASFDGKPLGSLGDISTLSFGRGKGWTGGGGGAVLISGSTFCPERVVDVPEFSRRVAAVAFGVFGQWAFARPAVYGIPASIPGLRLGETNYVAPTGPTGITRVAAATLIATSEAALREVEVRQANAAHLLVGVAENPRVRPILEHSASIAGYLRLPLRLSRGIAAFEDQNRARSLGIAPAYPKSLSELPQLAERVIEPRQVYSGAHTLALQLVTVPTHSRLHEIGLNQLITIVHAVRG